MGNDCGFLNAVSFCNCFLFFKCEAQHQIEGEEGGQWEQGFSDATTVQGHGKPDGGDQYQ